MAQAGSAHDGKDHRCHRACRQGVDTRCLRTDLDLGTGEKEESHREPEVCQMQNPYQSIGASPPALPFRQAKKVGNGSA